VVPGFLSLYVRYFSFLGLGSVPGVAWGAQRAEAMDSHHSSTRGCNASRG
jgi:hypothetical protein